MLICLLHDKRDCECDEDKDHEMGQLILKCYGALMWSTRVCIEGGKRVKSERKRCDERSRGESAGQKAHKPEPYRLKQQ